MAARLDQHSARRVLAHNVRSLRIARDLSQDDLATDAKVRQALISSIEAEKANPTLDSLSRIAIALKVDLASLFQSSSSRK
jgi:transcriptional regulator with XRE-family HTH domain